MIEVLNYLACPFKLLYKLEAKFMSHMYSFGTNYIRQPEIGATFWTQNVGKCLAKMLWL